MGTIASIVVALTGSTKGFFASMQSAEQRFAKFQKTLVGKAVGAGAVVSILKNAAHVVEDAFADMAKNGTSGIVALQQAVGNLLTSLPVAGDFAQAAVSFRDWVTGDMQELIRLQEEVERTAKRLKAVNQLRDAQLNAKGDNSALVARNALMIEFARIEEMALSQSEKRRMGQFKLDATINGITRSLSDQAEILKRGERGWLEYQLSILTADRAVIDAKLALYDWVKAEEARREAANRAADEARQFQEELQRTAESLQEQIDTFGMSAEAIERYRLAKAGASAEDLKFLESLEKQLDAMRKQKEMMDEGKRVFDQTRTPLEKYRQELERLQELLDAGAIDLDTFNRAVRQAKDGLRSTKADAPAAVERRFTSGLMPVGGQANNIFQKTFELQRKELKTCEDTKKLTQEVRDILRDRLSIIEL